MPEWQDEGTGTPWAVKQSSTEVSPHSYDPTNNLAERLLRFLVIRRRVSGGTQSEKGNRWIERIATLRETCRLRGKRSYPLLVDAVRARFDGRTPDLSWIFSA